LLYINQLPVSVDRTQNVLYIIQRRSDIIVVECTQKCIIYNIQRRVEFSQNLYPKCIKYHPTPIGATRTFRLMWSNGVLPKFVPKMY
jgi:hypothetical protein